MRYVKLEQSFKDILCCPICKASLDLGENQAICKECGSNYPNRNGIWDFKILPPDYCLPSVLKEWRKAQDKYESLPTKLAQLTNEEQERVYFNEIDSVKEIYTQEFSISGKVIDESSLSDKGTVSNLLARIKKKMRDEGVIGVFHGIISRLTHKRLDEHMFHWRYDDLLDLIRITGFKVEKIHWQKPPFEHCVYLTACKLKVCNREKSSLR